MVEREHEVYKAPKFHFSGILIKAVVGLAQKDGAHCGRDDYGNRVAQVERLHVGEAHGNRFVGLILSIARLIYSLAGSVGESFPIEGVCIFDYGEDELIAGKGDGDSERSVLVSAERFFAP